MKKVVLIFIYISLVLSVKAQSQVEHIDTLINQNVYYIFDTIYTYTYPIDKGALIKRVSVCCLHNETTYDTNYYMVHRIERKCGLHRSTKMKQYNIPYTYTKTETEVKVITKEEYEKIMDIGECSNVQW